MALKPTYRLAFSNLRVIRKGLTSGATVTGEMSNASGSPIPYGLLPFLQIGRVPVSTRALVDDKLLITMQVSKGVSKYCIPTRYSSPFSIALDKPNVGGQYVYQSFADCPPSEPHEVSIQGLELLNDLAGTIGKMDTMPKTAYAYHPSSNCPTLARSFKMAVDGYYIATTSYYHRCSVCG